MGAVGIAETKGRSAGVAIAILWHIVREVCLFIAAEDIKMYSFSAQHAKRMIGGSIRNFVNTLRAENGYLPRSPRLALLQTSTEICHFY